jgi:hypothetical protein
VAHLLTRLDLAGGAEQVTALAGRAAADVSLDDPGSLAFLLRALDQVGATGQLSTLLDRDPAAHVSLDDPGDLAYLLGALDRLHRARAAAQATTLLARDPGSHARIDDPHGVTKLLDALREAGATDQITTLASRAAADTSLNARYGTYEATRLLDALREAGARTQAAELIGRLPAAGLFGLFCLQEGRAKQFQFGREAGGSPAKPWAWTDLG